jgi:hypothetical protein
VTLMDPVKLTVEALQLAGHTDVHPDPASSVEETNISVLALSSAEYIWVQEEQGTTPHIRYSDRPSVRVVVYTNLGMFRATEVGREVQKHLQDAQGVKLSSGGIHRVITEIRPAREDIPGLPAGVGRSSALYTLILSSEEKWS